MFGGDVWSRALLKPTLAGKGTIMEHHPKASIRGAHARLNRHRVNPIRSYEETALRADSPSIIRMVVRAGAHRLK
jgi:nickel-dependent lactate racemase